MGNKNAVNKKDAMNPFFKLSSYILWLSIIIIVMYLAGSSNLEMNEVVELYNSLTVRRTNSKSNFSKPLYYLVNEEDGSISTVIKVTSNIYSDNKDKISNETSSAVVTINTGEIKSFGDNIKENYSGIKSGAITAGYYFYNANKNIDDCLLKTAGLMGNSQGEGRLGQWQGISKEKWVPNNYGTEPRMPGLDKLYSDAYSGQCADTMSGYTVGNLKSDLEFLVDRGIQMVNNKTNIQGTGYRIGFGPTQATYYGYQEAYLEGIDALIKNGVSLEDDLTPTHLQAMESIYVSTVFEDWHFTKDIFKSIDYTNVYNSISSNSEYNKYIERYGKDNVQSVIKYTMNFLGNYEKCANWQDWNGQALKRSKNALDCYDALCKIESK